MNNVIPVIKGLVSENRISQVLTLPEFVKNHDKRKGVQDFGKEKIASFQDLFLATEYALRYRYEKSSAWVGVFQEALEFFSKSTNNGIILDDVIRYGTKHTSLDQICSSNSKNSSYYHSELACGQEKSLRIPDSEKYEGKRIGIDVSGVLSGSVEKSEKDWAKLMTTLTGTDYSPERIKRILNFMFGDQRLIVLTKRKNERESGNHLAPLVLWNDRKLTYIDLTRPIGAAGRAYIVSYEKRKNSLANVLSDFSYELAQEIKDIKQR